MRTIEVSDEVYEGLVGVAADDGVNIETLLAKIVRSRPPVPENLDRLFMPEIIADLERISAEMAAGKSCTMEEVDAHLAERRAEWIRNQGT